MGKILRTNSDNKDFRKLVRLLDQDLNGINGEEQADYDKHNVIDFLDTIVLYYMGSTPVACGAFKEYEKDTVEIKRIYVNRDYRGRGISKLVVKELEIWAKELGNKKAILETGMLQKAAIGLYERLNYVVIDNYEPYVNLPNSLCMGKSL